MRLLLALLLVAGAAYGQQRLLVTHAASSYYAAGRPSQVAPRSLVRVSLIALGSDGPFVDVDPSQPIELTVESQAGGEPQPLPILASSFPFPLIAALPEDLPLGPATVTARFGGEISIEEPIEVVASEMRLFTLDSTFGPAVAQNVAADGAFEPNGLTTPARPGEYVTLWGSGLGHTAQQEVEVLLAGQPVRVEYAGAAPGAQGLDQINVFLPAEVGLTAGCYVPITIVVGERQSPFTTLTMAEDLGPCEHPLGLSAEQMAQLDAGGVVPVGSVAVYHTIGPVPEPARFGEILQREQALASFYEMDASGVAQRSRSLEERPPDACRVETLGGIGGIISITGYLNAGPNLTLSGPDERTLSLETHELASNFYEASLEPSPSTTDPEELPPPFFAGGLWDLALPGGEDIAPFSLAIPLSPPLELLNPGNLLTVDRTADLRVAWAPAGFASDQTVELALTALSPGSEIFATLTCRAPALAGELVVPANLLSELSAEGALDLPHPLLSLRVSRLAPDQRLFGFELTDGEPARGMIEAVSAIALPVTLR